MRYASLAAIGAISILLAACQNEAEETPDITEAIPLDPEEDESGALDEDTDSEGVDDSATPPAIMESGSNEDASIYGGENEGAPGPSGSKLQLADPVE